jgi:hypothetical protein
MKIESISVDLREAIVGDNGHQIETLVDSSMVITMM